MIFVYPLAQSLLRGQAENRGVVRQGTVEKNATMQARGLAGLPAYVTREEHGEVRFYVFTVIEKKPYYVGPELGLSEEII